MVLLSSRRFAVLSLPELPVAPVKLKELNFVVWRELAETDF
jgi:hypothetical protein